MELKSSVRALNYIRKLLTGETGDLLPFPMRVQKPRPAGRQTVPLPRSLGPQQDVPYAALNSLLNALSQVPGGNIHTCMVIRHGHVVCEAGWAPYSTSRWHVTHSLCKSFTGTAIGLLWGEGKLDLDEHVCDILPDKCSLLTSRRMRAVTVRHLLTMTSGVNFKEPGAVSAADWARSFLESDLQFDPGSQFDYNSMNTYLLAAILQRRTGMGLMEYLRPRLFEPLGFGDVAWETCPQGIEKGGWGMYVMLEDAAKLGLLYLQDGLWHKENGESLRILPEEWTRQARQPHAVSTNGEEYGYQMWPHTGDGLCTFNGMFGQYVFLVPDLDMVVAINAGAGNLFNQSRSFQAVLQFLNGLRSGDFSDTARSQEEHKHLLNHLAFGRPLAPAAAPPSRPGGLRGWLLRHLAPTPQTESETQRACRMLSGRRFVFDANNAGLLPMVTGCMNDYYPTGITSIAFRQEGGCLWMDWTQDDVTQRIRLGFETPYPFVLDAGGNLFSASAGACLRVNEDDRPVLKIEIDLLESSSSRKIKLFLPEPGSTSALLHLEETPSLMTVMQSLAKSNPLASQADQLFRDANYLRYRLEHFSTPTLEGREEDAADPVV